MYNIKSALIAAILLVSFSCSYASSPARLDSQQITAAKQDFSRQMAHRYHLATSTIRAIVNKITYNPTVIKHITHPAEKHPWRWYQSYFITTKRIKDGGKYWHSHAKTLQYAAKTYGVDPSIIVAIIGVETFYGQRTGHFNALDALGTLAFYYPPRSKFFSKELAQYILLCQQQHLDDYTVKSSYAGALGIPQFMPSSYRHYAVNYGDTKHINLFTNHNDAIVSVANYLHKNGWQANQPVALFVQNQAKVPVQLVSANITLNHSLNWYSQHDVNTKGHVNPQRTAGLIALDNIDSNEYWLVFKNFKTIMSYNTSKNYAMAIYQLSKKLNRQHHRG